MNQLKGYQRKFLKGLAHNTQPTVFVGQKGISDAVIKAAEDSLNKHELIKIKFIDYKEKDQKKEMTGVISEKTAAQQVGMIGHVAILYREHNIKEKRKIQIPRR